MNKYIKTEYPYKLTSPNPLDVRKKVQTIADRDALVTNLQAYESLQTYVVEEKKWYEYNGTEWVIVGGTSIDDTQASTTSTYSSSKIAELMSQATGGGAVIDDTTISSTTVFSSEKINTDYAKKEEIPNLTSIIVDDLPSENSTYSSNKIEEIVGQKTDIDDTVTSTTKTWSSERIIKIINSISDVYKVDEKPTCVDNGDGTYTTTYVKDGETKTTNDIAWYYYLVDGILYQTIFIEGDELSIKNSSLGELITVDETTGHWFIDGKDTGVSSKSDTLEPNINNSTTDYRLDVIGNDGTKKFTTDNLKGADGVLLDNIGYYGFTIEGSNLILHVNVENTSTGDVDDIAPPFSLDTGSNLWYTVGGKIQYVSKEVI